MKIYSETNLRNFNAWSGAVDTKKSILEAGFGEQFDQLIEEFYPEGIPETQLNDILWFELHWIYESLGMSIEE